MASRISCASAYGEVCYWPNLGYGRFGAKVTMGNAPVSTSPDLFDPRRIHLADIDGSGNTDIIYVGQRRHLALLQPVRQFLEPAAAPLALSAGSTISKPLRRWIFWAMAPPVWCGPPRWRQTCASPCATSTSWAGRSRISSSTRPTTWARRPRFSTRRPPISICRTVRKAARG